MPMFIDPNARVAVSDGRNTVFIKAKMDAGTRAAVEDAMRPTGGEVVEDIVIRGLGSYRLALLVHNVVAWEGPDFEGVPCTRGNLLRVDPTEPIWAEVAEQIGIRNKPRVSPDPNLATPTGGSADGA